MLLDHLGAQVADVDASVAVSLRALGVLGLGEAARHPVGDSRAVGIAGEDGFPPFWLGPPLGHETRGLQVAFRLTSGEAVDVVHETAVADGVEVRHAPRVWPEYHPRCSAVVLRDLDGHDVEAVRHGFEGVGP